MNVVAHAVEEAHALKCELAVEVLRSTGTLRFMVTGWSMMPAVRPGDTLIVERVNGAALQRGDIVLFGHDRRLIAHRLAEHFGHSHFLTRGDALSAADPMIGADEFLGRVSQIVRNGKSITPRRELTFSDRAIAALLRRSPLAARVIAGLHIRYQYRNPKSQSRAIVCHN